MSTALAQCPCPECGALVDVRTFEAEESYPVAMILGGLQWKRGPEHARRCPHYRHETSAVVSTHAIDALAILDWMHDAKDVPQPIQDAVWRCIEELRRHDKALPIEHPIGDWDAPPKVSMGPGHTFPIFTASVPQKPDG